MSAWAYLAPPPPAFGELTVEEGTKWGADGGSVVTVVGGSPRRKHLCGREVQGGGVVATEGPGTKGEGTLLTVPEEESGSAVLAES